MVLASLSDSDEDEEEVKAYLSRLANRKAGGKNSTVTSTAPNLYITSTPASLTKTTPKGGIVTKPAPRSNPSVASTAAHNSAPQLKGARKTSVPAQSTQLRKSIVTRSSDSDEISSSEISSISSDASSYHSASVPPSRRVSIQTYAQPKFTSNTSDSHPHPTKPLITFESFLQHHTELANSAPVLQSKHGPIPNLHSQNQQQSVSLNPTPSHEVNLQGKKIHGGVGENALLSSIPIVSSAPTLAVRAAHLNHPTLADKNEEAKIKHKEEDIVQEIEEEIELDIQLDEDEELSASAPAFRKIPATIPQPAKRSPLGKYVVGAATSAIRISFDEDSDLKAHHSAPTMARNIVPETTPHHAAKLPEDDLDYEDDFEDALSIPLPPPNSVAAAINLTSSKKNYLENNLMAERVAYTQSFDSNKSMEISYDDDVEVPKTVHKDTGMVTNALCFSQQQQQKPPPSVVSNYSDAQHSYADEFESIQESPSPRLHYAIPGPTPMNTVPNIHQAWRSVPQAPPLLASSAFDQVHFMSEYYARSPRPILSPSPRILDPNSILLSSDSTSLNSIYPNPENLTARRLEVQILLGHVALVERFIASSNRFAFFEREKEGASSFRYTTWSDTKALIRTHRQQKGKPTLSEGKVPQ